MCFGLEVLRFLIAQTPVPGRGLRAPSLFGRFPWSDFLFPCPPAASALPWRRLVYSSPENLFHELSTPFCVRNTSQTRNFEICLRPPRRFAHGRVDERVRETSLKRRRRLGRKRLPRQAHRPAAARAGRAAHCRVGRAGRSLAGQHTVGRQRRGAGAAHTIHGARAGDGTLAHPIDGARAALRTCGSRATWLVSCLQLPCYSPACCSCPC